MLLAGDEFSNTQAGNNNAYCQDNEIGWLNWDKADGALQGFVQQLSAFRRAHPAVRQAHFLHGEVREQDGCRDVEWTDFAGAPVEWHDPALDTLCLTLRCSADAPLGMVSSDAVFIVFNRGSWQGDVVLPVAPEGQVWLRAIDTTVAAQSPRPEHDKRAIVCAHSVVAFVPVPWREHP
jgi:isoamylase